MAKESVHKFFRFAATVIGIIVVISTLVAGVIETRVNINTTKEDVRVLENRVSECLPRLRVLEKQALILERKTDHQGTVLDDIKDTLGKLHTEQQVQGQWLKSFISEYYRRTKGE